MKTVTSISFVAIAILTASCDSPSNEVPDRLTAHFDFSPYLAENLSANHIEMMLKSGGITDKTPETIEIEVTNGLLQTSITFEVFHLGDMPIDYPVLRFSKSQAWMNEEPLNAKGMASRLRQYSESANLVKVKPVAIVRFEDECSVSFLIETALFLEQNGIVRWGLSDHDFKRISQKTTNPEST